MAHLGVQIVTKNEEQNIIDCINNVKSIADEIVVVDTGSTDMTVQLARAHGAKVIQTTWTDDFAAVRNVGLSYATADWVLILDADERLRSPAPELVQYLDFLDHAGKEAASVIIENVLNEDTGERLCHSAVRLFRARTSYQFTGPIHEDVTTSILHYCTTNSISNPIADSQIRIIHDGYLPTVMERKDKVRRNLQILTTALSEHPDSPFYLYHLGITQSQMGDWASAKHSLLHALTLVPVRASYRSTLVLNAGKALLHEEEFQTAERLLQCYICDYPDYPDLHYLHGITLEALGHLERATCAYQRAIDCNVNLHRYVSEVGVATFRAHDKIGRIALRLNRLDIAESAFCKALKIHPQFVPAYVGYAEVLYRRGLADEEIWTKLQMVVDAQVDGRADGQVDAQTVEEQWWLTRVMYQIGAYHIALNLILRLIQDIGSIPVEFREIYYECLMFNGCYADAEHVLHELQQQGSHARLAVDHEVLVVDLALARLAQSASQSGTQLAEHLAECLQLDTMGHMLNRMLHFGMLALVESLVTIQPDLASQLPRVLYRHGYILIAANKLIDVMEQRQLSPEELCIVADVLVMKQHYQPALDLFEQAAEIDQAFRRAHVGAARCCLQLALADLAIGLQNFPHHPLLSEDMQQIKASLTLLEGLSESPPWTPAQRRNHFVRTIEFTAIAPTSVDFTMRDCEK